MGKNKYNCVVLGGGPGGYVAAIRASQLGMKTAIIEKDALGGICLNWGCIPTKALLKNAEVLNTVKNSKKYGITVDGYSVDFPANIKRSRQVSERLSKGIGFLLKKNKIDHLVGEGKLIDKNTLSIEGKQKITADHIIIATGAKPRVIPGMEIDGKRIIGSKHAMSLTEVPKKLIIIGSGAIGVEFAYYYQIFGTKIHLIEMEDRILPLEDESVSKEIEKSFKKSGMKIHTSAKVDKISSLKTKVKVQIKTENGSDILEGDLALLAVGVQGNIENIGLKKVGIKTENNAIKINEYNQTNIKNIYAIGDVSGPPWLAHVASAQGHVAAEHAASQDCYPVDYTNIPGCTYCQPQVGSLGLTELQAREKGYNVKVGKFDFRASGKAMATGDTTGFVKLIFDQEHGELLGAHIVGSEATELIAELGMAKALESTWEDLALTVHAHPTLSEAIMEAALDAYSGAIHQ